MYCMALTLCIYEAFSNGLTQVYDRDLTTDDFMGSSSVALGEVELEKYVENLLRKTLRNI